nr:acyltransferase [Marinicella sp. NBU2979]
MRAMAATLVAVFHLIPHFNRQQWQWPELFAWFSEFAYAGVDVFFVISGYVIWISTQSKAQPPTTGHFIYNRATRIYFGYWPYFLLILGLVFWLAPARLDSVDLTGSFFLTQIGIHKLLLPIAWTLTYELYFYLWFAALLLLPRAWLKPTIGLLMGMLVLIQGYHIWAHDIYAIDNFPYIPFYLTFMTSPFCLEFLSGCLIGMYFQQRRIPWVKTGLLLALVWFVLGLWYQKTHIMPTGSLTQGYFLPQRVLVFGVVSVLLVACMVELEHRGTQLTPRLSKWLGGASYSIYLAHIPLIFMAKELGFIGWLTGTLPWQELAFVVMLSLILLYSVLHYRIIEQPLMKLAKAGWQKWARRGQQQTPA